MGEKENNPTTTITSVLFAQTLPRDADVYSRFVDVGKKRRKKSLAARRILNHLEDPQLNLDELL